MDGRKKREKIRRLNENLDILIGSEIVNYLKCGKDCTCNKGKKHKKYYLSTKEGGKTNNLYLPPNAVKEAEEMSRRYKKVKTILQEISRLNYEALKERHLTKGR
jgi:predicted transcriptional regulator